MCVCVLGGGGGGGKTIFKKDMKMFLNDLLAKLVLVLRQYYKHNNFSD